MYVSEAVLERAYSEISGADVRVAVMHHPINWFPQDEQALIQRFLTHRFSAVMCGHKHDNNASALHSNVGHLFTSNTGCLYQSLDYFNGYSIVQLDLERSSWSIFAREYYAERDEFDVSTRFGEGGRWVVPFSNFGSEKRILISTEVVRAVQERANNLLLSYSASELAPKSIGAIFVEPPLSFQSEKELAAHAADGTVASDTYTTLANLAKESRTLIFVGKREAGKSILLHHIAIAEYGRFQPSARIGVVVDLHALKRVTEAGILEQAVEFCGGELRRRDLLQLLQSGDVLVCIDNVRLHEGASIKLVADFLAKYPNARYVLAASEEILDSLPSREGLHFNGNTKKVFIHSFRKKHTKELVKKWFGENDVRLNQRIQFIDRLVSRLRVPRTPFLVSVLSWVLEQRPHAHLINQSSVIEVLIEGLLEKFSESKFRKEFDSTIQQHFLMEFAGYLDEKDVEWISSLDFDAYVTQYFKQKGLAISIEGFAAEFLRKGVLYSFDERVGFKFDCFRAFFLAKKFFTEPSLWKTALANDKVRKYVYELDLLTGLHRDRREILVSAQELCRETYLNYCKSNAIEGIDNLEANIGPSVLGAIERALESEADGAGDGEMLEMQSADHDVSRKRAHLPDAGEITRFVESLRAFSVILRNSELVSDVDLKSKCVGLALEMWAALANVVIQSIAGNMSIVARQLNITGASKEADMDALVRALVPQMVAALMSEVLASPKLDLFILERAKDDRTMIRVMSTFLAVDTDHVDAPELIRGLLKDYRKKTFVVEMVFFKLLQVALLGGVMGPNKRYRDSLADAFIVLKGGSLVETANNKSRFLTALDKNIYAAEL